MTHKFSHVRIACVGLGAVLASGGCSIRSEGGIPLGKFSGSGTYLLEMKEGASQPQQDTQPFRTYETELSTCVDLDSGVRKIVFNVTSHSALDRDGGAIRLEFDLSEKQKLSDGLVWYTHSENEKVPASLIVHDGVAVLYLEHDEGFWETYRFEGRTLEKLGSMATEETLIRWNEQLHWVGDGDPR